MGNEERWTSERIPDQSGRTALVTGANSGLGLASAKALARAGADVVLACRDRERGERAAAEVRGVATATVAVERLDLASLASVRELADRFLLGWDGLDLLINNAGVMATPHRRTADGFELQLGIDHLGHFALTGLLLPSMLGRPDARVVTVTSVVHRLGRIRFDDLQAERRYRRWPAYFQSKLANLLFAVELERRLRGAGASVKSLAAHPGYADTNLTLSGRRGPRRWAMQLGNRLLAQSAARGALPQLYAATEPRLAGGILIGPGGFGGHPVEIEPARRARDHASAERLWQASAELTGVSYRFG